MGGHYATDSPTSPYKWRLWRIFRVPYRIRTHNNIVIKLRGDIVSRLDRRLAKCLLSLINHDNYELCVRNITRFKLDCPRSTLVEKYLLYRYKFSRLDFYSDIGNKIPLASVDESITHTVRELCELRDHVNTCHIVSGNMVHVLRGGLCIG